MEIPTGFIEAEANGFRIVTRPVYYRIALSIAEQDPENVLARSGGGPAVGPMQGRGVRAEIPGQEDETLVLKKQRRGGLYGRFFGDVHRSDFHAMSEVILSESAWKKGVPVALTAFALAAPAGEGRLARYWRGYTASIKVPGARSLMEMLGSPIPEAERRAVIAATAEAVKRAHNRGLKHGDLNLGNILLVLSDQGEYGAWLIDLRHSRLGGSLTLKPRVENLVRLYRSAEKWLPPGDTAGSRRRMREVVRFLRTYTDGERGRVRRVLEEAARHRASLFLHRMTWGPESSRRRADVSRAGSRPGG